MCVIRWCVGFRGRRSNDCGVGCETGCALVVGCVGGVDGGWRYSVCGCGCWCCVVGAEGTMTVAVVLCGGSSVVVVETRRSTVSDTDDLSEGCPEASEDEVR